MSASDLDGSPSQDDLEQLLPSRTTEEIVEAMIAADPRKHGRTLAQRVRQMVEILKQDNQPDDWQRVYELRVEQIGGDPDELLPGNKPRYTMGDDLEIKDHQTGEIHHVADQHDVSEIGGPTTPLPVEHAAATSVDQCEHTWPEPIQAETPCSLCGLKFGDWAQE